jgi:hypothetical protein
VTFTIYPTNLVGTWHRDRPTWWEPADGRNKSGHSPGPPRSAGLIMAGLGLARRHSAHDGRTVMRLRTRRIQSRRTCRTQAADSLAGPPGRAAAGAALPRPDLSGKLEALRLRPLTGAAAHPARAGPAPSHAGWLPQLPPSAHRHGRRGRPASGTGNLKQCGIVTPTGRVYSAGPGRWLTLS